MILLISLLLVHIIWIACGKWFSYFIPMKIKARNKFNTIFFSFNLGEILINSEPLESYDNGVAWVSMYYEYFEMSLKKRYFDIEDIGTRARVFFLFHFVLLFAFLLYSELNSWWPSLRQQLLNHLKDWIYCTTSQTPLKRNADVTE